MNIGDWFVTCKNNLGQVLSTGYDPILEDGICKFKYLEVNGEWYVLTLYASVLEQDLQPTVITKEVADIIKSIKERGK